MIGFANSGAGRDRLRLRVLSGSGGPENAGSSISPMENDIWVDTAIPVSGYEFSEVDHPTGAKAKGYVYFTSTYVGGYAARDTTGLNFFKMKEGAHYAKLLRCWQYDGSGWKGRAAYVFHGTSWHRFAVIWDGTLFYDGDQYPEHTGGWTGMVSRTDGVHPSKPNLFSDANLVYTQDCLIHTVNKVDLGPFKTLKFTGWGYGSNSEWEYPAHCTVQDSAAKGESVLSKGDFKDNGTYSIDITNISGSHYIVFWSEGSRGNRLSISKVWLE